MGAVTDGSQRWKTRLEELMSVGAIAEYESILREFGWEEELDTKLYEVLKKQLSKSKVPPFNSMDESPVEWFRKEVKTAIHNAYPKFAPGLGVKLYLQEEILDYASVIATSALGVLTLDTSNINPVTNNQYNPYVSFSMIKS
ncbi:hypothetical protein MMC20_002714 [Loxospora ochrophaea]|nr:hypothetical protein [Loxospora ochrophaea]